MSTEPFDPQKRHYEIEYDDERKAIVCTRCGKILEERERTDTMLFLGGIFVKQNLPCEAQA